MRNRLFLFIGLTLLFLSFCVVAGAQSDEVEWLEPQEYTLYWGDEINHSGYFIKAVDFSPAAPSDVDTDYVLLSVSSVHHDSWGAILALNNSDISNNTVFDDRLNITALEVVTGNDIPSPYTTLNVAISNSTGTLPVTIEWMDATLEIEEQSSDEIYIDERAYFTLELKNLKDIHLESVNIKDSIPPEFVFDPDSRIKWNMSLEPYEKKILEYSLKALKPGTYEFNGTMITVENEGRTYSRQLNASSIVVHGPFINVSKKVSGESVSLNDEINITVNVLNEGDRAAYVKVNDHLPVGAVLIAGDTGKSRVVHAKDNFSFSYSVRMNKAGDIIIPVAMAEFVDSKEYEGTVYSNKELIRVQNTNEATTSVAVDESVTSDNTYSANDPEISDPAKTDETSQDQQEEIEDHGKLQFLYDVLGSITNILKNTKDKIL